MTLKKKFPVTVDSDLLHLPFTLDEIETYLRLDLKKMVISGDDLAFFMIRVANTAKQVKEVRMNFENEIKRVNSLNSHRQTVSVDPMQAAKFLTREQQIQLLDQLSRDHIKFLDREKEKYIKNSQIIDSLISAMSKNDMETVRTILASITPTDR